MTTMIYVFVMVVGWREGVQIGFAVTILCEKTKLTTFQVSNITQNTCSSQGKFYIIHMLPFIVVVRALMLPPLMAIFSTFVITAKDL